MDNSFGFNALPTMLPTNLTHLAVLFLSFCAVFSFPSRPLNERAEDIAWQAWLLVDDQNQNNNKQQYSSGDDGMLRKRITSKSVFIAPTFSPDDLPACAEGYTSDSMNRCVPIFKLDEDARLNFLLNKLSNKFGDLDMGGDEEDFELEEVIETKLNNKPDRLQIDIPLLPDDDDNTKKKYDEVEPEMTIIITPTSKTSQSGLKLDKREDDLRAEEELRKLFRKTSPASTTTERVTESTVNDLVSTTEKIDDVTDGRSEITTNSEESTESTENNYTEDSSASTTFSDEDTVSSITSTETSTTYLEYGETLPTVLPPKVTTYHPKIKIQEPSSTTTKFLIRFPDDDEELEEMTVKPTSPKHHIDFVRFPSSQVIDDSQQKSLHHHTRDVHREAEFLTTAPKHSSDRLVFPQDQPMADEADRVVFPSAEKHADQATAANGLTINMDKDLESITPNARKSRGKNILLPSRWEATGQSDGIQKRPLVLRLRKQIFVDSDQFKNKKFYRSVPAHHLSYLFGYNSPARNR